MARNLRNSIQWSLFALLLTAVPAAAGTLTLAWDPSSGASVIGYRLSYGTQPGTYTTTVDVGNRTIWQVRSLAGGQRFYFVVRAYDSWGQMSGPSAEVSGIVLGITTLLSDVTSPSPSGKSLTWTAVATEGIGVEYAFFRYSQASGTWTNVQPYGIDSTYTWTPNPGEEGTYAIQVWARVIGSSENYEAYRGSGSFTIADSPILVGSFEADVALPASTGTRITWRVEATGGPAPLQYRFYRFSQTTNTWTMVRDYDPSNTYSWVPSSSDEGRYALQVWVRRSGSLAVYDAWRASEFFEVKNGPVVIAALSAGTAFPSGTGQPITWRALAAGGAGPLEYRFWRFSQATNQWVNVQSYGTSNTYTWTPAAAEQGTYALQVWVRRQGSTAAYEAWLGSGYFQIEDRSPVIQSVRADRAAPVGLEAPITWTVDATGGPGPLEYRFWLYHDSSDTWSIARDYNTVNSFAWIPREAGNFALMVGVRRAGSTARYEAYYATTLFSVAGTAPNPQSLLSNVGSSAPVGTPITWTTLVSGGTGRLEYRFWRLDLTKQTWTLLQDYSWDRTFKWVPLAGAQGRYVIQVWVRRAGSTASFEGYVSSPTFTVN
jgi:hypothetical protein